MRAVCQHPNCKWAEESESDLCVLEFLFDHSPESEHPLAYLYNGDSMVKLDADFATEELRTTWRTLPCDEVPDPEPPKRRWFARRR